MGIGKRILLGLCLLVPMRCEHCLHKFTVPWFSTIGKPKERPAQRHSTHPYRPAGPSWAAQHRAASPSGDDHSHEVGADKRRFTLPI